MRCFESSAEALALHRGRPRVIRIRTLSAELKLVIQAMNLAQVEHVPLSTFVEIMFENTAMGYRIIG
ncbi:unnamed protein product [Protopolystoma xenopodis]|uniref:Uncharacterized protein n=1 Tax=Protopolystoma xenopodis TaxID=117903 RepID=A0A448X7E9_9PLAT|nr:unnamed protein product [Protopolystoma xenopodis]